MGSKGQGAKNRFIVIQKEKRQPGLQACRGTLLQFLQVQSPKAYGFHLYFEEMYSCSLFRIENKYSLHLREAMHEVKSSHKI